MSLGKKMIRGSVLNLFDQGLRFIAVFIMTPLIVLTLGDEKYGFWALLMSIVGHYSLLDFGLSLSASRFFAKAAGKGDSGELSKLISTTLHIFFRIGGLALVLSGVAYVIAPVLISDAEQLKFARFIIVLYGAFICVGFPVRVFRSFLKSQLRYDMVVLGSAAQIIVGNTALFFYLKGSYGNELYALAVINVGAGCLEYLVVFWFGLKGMRNSGVNKQGADRKIRSELLRFSLVAFLTSVGHRLRSQIDPIIIAWWVGIASVTYYKIGLLFPMYFADVVGAVLGGQMLAMFSQIHGRGDSDTLKATFITASKLSAVIATFCGSAMIFYGDEFLLRWMKDPDFSESYQVMVIVTVPFIFMLMQYPSLSLLQALGQHRYLMWMMLGGGVGNLVLSVLLVQWLGMLGVVWATAIEMTIVYLIVLPKIIAKVADISWIRLYRDAVVIPLIKSVAILAPFYFLVHGYLEPKYGRLVLLGSFQVIYFLPLAFFLIPSSQERKMILRTVRRGAGVNEGARN